MNRKIVIMVSFPQRKNGMLHVINQLIDQCDEFCLLLNEYTEIPKELNKFDKNKLKIQITGPVMSKLKDKARLTVIEKYLDDYVLIVDDDIFYPKDYVIHTIDQLKKYGEKCVVTYNANIYKLDKRLEKYYFYEELQNDVHVNFIGTGVCCFKPSLIGLNHDVISTFLNCDGRSDDVISVWCYKNHIDMICLKHSKDYMPSLKVDNCKYHLYRDHVDRRKCLRYLKQNKIGL